MNQRRQNINRDWFNYFHMTLDPFWATKMQSYISLYRAFHKEMRDIGLGDEDINQHWLLFRESVCDCEGCREESDCVIRIDVPEEDEWDEGDE